MTTTPPGGWYQDPSGPPGLQRWWDGTTWTDHTQVAMAPPPVPPTHLGPPLVSYGRRLGGWLIDWLLVGVVFDAHTTAERSARVEPITTLYCPRQSSAEKSRPQRVAPT